MKHSFMILTVLLLLAGLTVPSGAQKAACTKIFGGSGYFMTGYSRMNVTLLNTRFSAQGIPGIAEGGFFLGGGGHYVCRNVIMGGEGGGVISSPSSGGRYGVTSSGGYGFMNVGYMILKRGAVFTYPLVGIGGGGMSVLITDKTGLPAGFDEVLRDPAHQSLLMHGGFMLNFSIGVDWFVGGVHDDGETGGWLIGMKAGYILDTGGKNWMLDNQRLTGAPAAGMSGFYLRLTLGGGGFVRK
jgi:hypothetical protein